MKKQRAYIDTSVIGGCFDREFAEHSNALFRKIEDGEITAVISDITAEELERAPDFVQENFLKLPPNSIEKVESDKESVDLEYCRFEQNQAVQCNQSKRRVSYY